MNANDVICQGYRRPDGSKGLRNKVLVVYTVECSKHVSERIAALFQGLGYDVESLGNCPCLENDVVVRRILRYATHPNVGAVLAVGHGCEYIAAEKIAAFAAESGRPARWLVQQEAGGTAASIALGTRLVEEMLAELESTPREPMRLEELCVGVECGGSDFTSGLAGNALVGGFVDRLTQAGGTVVFEEIHEALGLCEYLVSRGASPEAREDIAAAYEKMVRYCVAFGEYSISPGNFVGGLTTIEEKSMGAVVKTGTGPIQGVLKIAQAPPHPGIWAVDVISDSRVEPFFFSGGDATAMMDLAAAGAHLVFLVSGRGHVAGIPVSPVVKITGNRRTYERMADDFDVDASVLLDGRKGQQALCEELYAYVRAVAAGRLTCAERLGQREGLLPLNYQHPCKVCNELPVPGSSRALPAPATF